MIPGPWTMLDRLLCVLGVHFKVWKPITMRWVCSSCRKELYGPPPWVVVKCDTRDNYVDEDQADFVLLGDEDRLVQLLKYGNDEQFDKASRGSWIAARGNFPRDESELPFH